MRQSREQIESGKCWLAAGHTPAEVMKRFHKIRRQMSRRDFLGQAGINHELEAFSAARFGQMLGAKEVFIGDNPDARIVFPNGEVVRAEIVSADRPGRRMSEEDFPEAVPINRDYLSSIEAQFALEVACAKKTQKNYAGAEVDLIIYLNGFWILEEHHRKVLIAGTKMAGAKFGVVYVHDGYGISRAWKGGRPAYRRW